MKHLILFTCLVMLPLSNAFATDGGKTLASTLDVYVFPTEGQAADQQSKDEADFTCHGANIRSGKIQY